MFFPTYALLSHKVIVDPILYISTGSTATVTLNVLTGGTEYLIGNNTIEVPLSFNSDTEYLIGVNTPEIPILIDVDTEYLIGNITVEVPLSASVDTEYVIGNNTTEPAVSMGVDTEYLIANNTVEVPITMKPIREGEVSFTIPGTYSWTAPVGVTSVSAVAIGAGSSGCIFGGGGGGGLGWKNNITVVPGQTYTVVVGNGGIGSGGTSGSPGGQSYFIDASTVQGGGGGPSYFNPSGSPTWFVDGAGGGYVGDDGGNGGDGQSGQNYVNNSYSGGGNAGTVSNTGITQYTGAGYNGGGGQSNGDGAGLHGQGSRGSGMSYGGGAYGAHETPNLNKRRAGGGAVRIIWGVGRSFPDNAI